MELQVWGADSKDVLRFLTVGGWCPKMFFDSQLYLQTEATQQQHQHIHKTMHLRLRPRHISPRVALP